MGTLIALLIAVPMFLGIYFLDFDLFDTGLKDLLRVENNELDELVTAFAVIIFGLVIDRFRARTREKRRAEIEAQRLRVLKATMTTVQDLVNTFLNNVQLFRMEAEDGHIAPESLKLLDTVILETAEKLKALGDLEVVHETEMAIGIGIGYRYPDPKPHPGQIAIKQ